MRGGNRVGSGKPKTAKPKRAEFAIRLDPPEAAKLRRIREATGLSYSKAVAMLIRQN